MIVIKQNCINKLVFTLFEKQITCTDIFLIEIVNATTNGSYYCVALDRSCSPERYNAFCIPETNCLLPGQYSYNIYENPDSLLVPTGLNCVESGRLLVIGVDADTTSYQSQVNPNLQVYDNKSYNNG
jgi:hypothetical protein